MEVPESQTDQIHAEETGAGKLDREFFWQTGKRFAVLLNFWKPVHERLDGTSGDNAVNCSYLHQVKYLKKFGLTIPQ